MSEIEYSSPTPNQEKKRSGLWFLEVGVLEIFFVLLLLMFIFGAMNFLGIIHLDNLFSNLSFLPHVPSTTNNSKSPVIFKKNTDTFSYNKPFAQTKLTETLQEFLQPQFLPPDSIKIDQDFFVDKTGTSTHANAFSMQWQVDARTFNSYFYFAPKTNTPLHMVTFATIVSDPNQKPTIVSVEKSVNEVFKDPAPLVKPFSCSITDTNYSCAKAIYANNNIYWLGAYTQPSKPNSAIVFSCVLFESKTPTSSSSCLSGQ